MYGTNCVGVWFGIRQSQTTDTAASSAKADANRTLQPSSS